MASGVVISKTDKDFVTGVTVLKKGTKNGTQTDFDGKFSIEVSNPNPISVFSYVGMVTRGNKWPFQS
ncbi:CarboxypepD_reg-like domain-containing protein [Maribacter dokdonensis]|uniref:carboxypeptidase-like regulatory domain-containing protein n=1 Tax=Maribacter dokdonensis TaxID=320912 RepID=UPI001B0A447A|nr:carboxypeptidase-like regulatory domain-containing protein [Maribacter dokdonensis]CAG2532823.1 CarboxypepD_reg-like domain-containing protein [Maribacter dokdonensis]|tara:strand:- start:77 stop:277 length:201 start_codon:yes stop_codon:yes gene_type:complete